MIYYVNAAATRVGCGTKEAPFRHINDAAQLAVAGDEIIVAPGVYREYVNPQNAGTEDNRTIGQVFELYPLTLALFTADMEATFCMEKTPKK